MKEFKIKKIIILLLLTFISILGIKNVVAEATAPSSLKMKYRNYNPPISFPQTFHIKETTSGKYVYCATYAKKMPVTSITYNRVGTYTDPGINYILEQGYNAKNDKDYFVAQTAFWIYLMDTKRMNYSNSVNTFKSKISSSSNTYATRIKNLVKKAKSMNKTNQNNPTIKLSNGSVAFSLSKDGKYYLSNNITVNSSEKNYKISLVKAPNGTTYTKNGNNIIVKIPTSSVNNIKKTFSIKVNNTKTIFKSYKYKPSNSSYQVMSATYPITKNASASKSMSIVVDKITISKQDVTSKAELPGAKLEILNSNSTVVDSWTSTKTPHEISLNPGTYTLKETIAPTGYDLSTEAIKFTVTNKGVANKVVMYNTPSKKEIKKTTISKQDITTKEEIAGATLELKDSTGNIIETWTSTTTPHVITDLKPGTYTLIETQAPVGYELSTEKVTFEVDEEGDTTPVVMYNTPKKKVIPQVIISKQDSSTKQQIEGATLEIIDASGEVVETFVTETTSHVMTTLEPGTYTLVEKEAPEGYELTNEKVTFEVKEDSEENVNVIMYNNKEKEEVPETTQEEVAVPSTASFGSIITKAFGGIILIIGSVLITKNLKKKNGI